MISKNSLRETRNVNSYIKIITFVILSDRVNANLLHLVLLLGKTVIYQLALKSFLTLGH